MYTLYGLQGSCSLAPHIALEEAGLPFDFVMIRRGHEEDRSKLLSLNSMGQVPVLALENGKVLTQNLAILPFIASKAKAKKLLPEQGTFEFAKAMEWLAFLGTTAHPSFAPFFLPSLFHGEASQQAAVVEAAKKQVDRVFQVAEERASDGPWMMGADFGLVDIYHFTFFRWLRLLGIDGEAAYPKLHRHAEASRAREATARAMAREKVRY
jgi:glutathione S-transferase